MEQSKQQIYYSLLKSELGVYQMELVDELLTSKDETRNMVILNDLTKELNTVQNETLEDLLAVS